MVKKYLDYDLIIKTYNKIKNIEKTAQICKVHRDTVTKILKENNIIIISSKEISINNFGKNVAMYKNNELLHTFPSYAEAARFLIDNNYTTAKIKTVSAEIGRCINYKRKAAYGFVWKKL